MRSINIVHILKLMICLILFVMSSSRGGKIYSIEPDSGPAGTIVSIKGSNLATTRLVLFACERSVKRAKIKVKSNREVLAIAPDVFRPGVSATIVVVTADSATIAAPPSAQIVSEANAASAGNNSFYHVKANGVVRRAGGVAVIEPGGTVLDGANSPLVLVKRGGYLDRYENTAGFIIEEPGSRFGARFLSAKNADGRILHLPVGEITVSRGIDPYVFEAPVAPRGESIAPPRIDSINPPYAKSGDIIELNGSGFLETTNILFVNSRRYDLQKAGFQVVSDRRIRIEVPTDSGFATGQNLIVAINPAGASVTIPAIGFAPVPHGIKPLDIGVAASGIVTPQSFVGVVFAGDGGIVTTGGSMLFVTNGGRVVADRARAVVYESNVKLPESLEKNGGGNVIAVKRIRFCKVNSLLITL